jgi:hypothetical protein
MKIYTPLMRRFNPFLNLTWAQVAERGNETEHLL